MRLTFRGRVEPVRLAQEAVHFTQRKELGLSGLAPTILKNCGDFFTQGLEDLRHEDQVIDGVSGEHGAGVHHGQSNDGHNTLRKNFGPLVIVVVGRVHHPLNEVIRLLVVWVGLLSVPTSVDHGHEELVGSIVQLLSQLSDARQPSGNQRTQDLGEGTEQEDGDANVVRVADEQVQPVLITAQVIANNDTRGGAAHEGQNHVVETNRHPAI